MTQSSCYRRLLILIGLVLMGLARPVKADRPSAAQVARQIDELLAEEVFSAITKLAPQINDATYLRRVWLDIVGDIPSPEHVTAFLLDPAKDKRKRIVRELLANPQYGQNWARYWRDVILYRRLEDRAAIVSNPLTVMLTERFNNNEPWNKIATEFITAKGDVRENGATAIQMAQDGRTEETTAEVSRIFLGIQIQCAQCHDHKTDSWTREQFHELAAFFPRIAVQPVQSPVRRSFAVVVDDGPGRRRRNPNQNGRRPEPEHFMPILSNPSARGIRMQPKFFLTHAELPYGIPDAERRGTLAKWLTDNSWFATAFVNRIWSELVGEGYYEPIDDIGPERTPTAPKAVALLSRNFAESSYDVKWLFRVITATEAYQRESRPRRDVDGTPFIANVAQPLRSDQLYSALLTATDLAESDEPMERRRRRQQQAMPRYGRDATVRTAFEVAFGYDPSDPRESVTSSIPQALAMMNGARINQAVRALRSETILGRLLEDFKDDDLIVELYLRTLSREPTNTELDTAKDFVSSVDKRSAAFEDLFWALLNSSEFSHRR